MVEEARGFLVFSCVGLISVTAWRRRGFTCIDAVNTPSSLRHSWFNGNIDINMKRLNCPHQMIQFYLVFFHFFHNIDE